MNKRREEILAEVENCESLCDVGCDHGYVGFECLKRGKAKNVIFSDISAPSLEKAKALVKSEGDFEGRATFCVANGLEKAKGVDSCVIAGMGGEEIMKILAGDIPEFCVLQPMSEVEKLREFLQEKGNIKTDRLFYDRGKYYNLITLERGSCKLSKFQIMFGKSNLEKPCEDFLEFATARLLRQKAIKAKRSVKNPEDDEIIEFLEKFLEKRKTV